MGAFFCIETPDRPNAIFCNVDFVAAISFEIGPINARMLLNCVRQSERAAGCSREDNQLSQRANRKSAVI